MDSASIPVPHPPTYGASWIMATHNAHKVQEIGPILRQSGIALIPPPAPLPVPPEENAGTFYENALIKARAFAKANPGYAVLADDSGLCVQALNGAPGLYSARWAGEGASDVAHCKKLLDGLEGVPFEERQARFVCVLVLLKNAADPLPAVAVGVWDGLIATQYEAGAQGFGYDPVFYVPEKQCTAAQLPAAEKNRISHRGQALQALLSALPVSQVITNRQ